jgi:hypothetical protein
MRALLVAALASGLLAGCASDPVKKDVASDGLPVWISQPCANQPAEALCSVAESDFAGADVEAAKTDAETACKNRIADQLQAEVGRLTERLSSAMKDLGKGKIYGERTLKDINQNFQQISLRGLRYTDYFFYPDRANPKKVWVRALLTIDTNKFSQDVMAAMESDAAAEKLEMKHEDAMNRFEAVRQQYLQEKAAAKQPAPQK